MRRNSKFFFLNPDEVLFGKKYTFDPEKYKHIISIKKSFWGLLGTYNSASFSNDCAKLEWQSDVLKNNPSHLQSRYRISKLLVLGGFIFLIFSFVLFFVPLGFLVFIASFVYFSVLKSSVKAIAVDLVKYDVCKKRGWIYNPVMDGAEGFELTRKYPFIFKRGDENYVEDQIWGTIPKSNRQFHSGIFTRVEIKKDSRGSRSREYYYYNFFAVNIEKKFPVDFSIYQENFLSRIGQKFSSKEIDVESIKFNKTFAFSYTGSKDSVSMDITKLLSPAVQLQLLDLNKLGKGLAVFFTGDKLVFLFKGIVLKNLKSNLIKGFNIDKRDIDTFDTRFEKFNQIASELVEKL